MVGFAFTSWALLLVTTHGTLHTGCQGQETAPVPHDVDDLGSPIAENPLGECASDPTPYCFSNSWISSRDCSACSSRCSNSCTRWLCGPAWSTNCSKTTSRMSSVFSKLTVCESISVCSFLRWATLPSATTP